MIMLVVGVDKFLLEQKKENFFLSQEVGKSSSCC